MLISDPGSWINRPCMSREKFHAGSVWRFMLRKREFYGVICRCFARFKCGICVEVLWVVFRSAVIAAKVIYCVIHRRSWQVCGWAHVTRKLCAKRKNASWVFSVLGDFALDSEPILCSKIVDFKSSVLCGDLAMGLMVWLTKKLYFLNISNSLFISSQNAVTSAREIYRLLPAIKLWLLSLSYWLFPVFHST